MRFPVMPVLAAVLAAAATGGIAVADRGGRDDDDRGERWRAPNPYSIGLWGDVPYNDEQKTTGVPNLITDMNAQRLAFSAHNGDLKAGAPPCPDELYTSSKAFFNTLEAPAVFTPGDNDWTDCDRLIGGQPAADSEERLNFERGVFFDTPFTLGQRRLRQEVQAAPYVENRRWAVRRVTYATLNVVGSCNNLCDTVPDPVEYAARNAANIAWLKETFAQAAAERSAAVMIIFQANPGFDVSDPKGAPTRDPRTLAETTLDASGAPLPDGFREFLLELRAQTVAFRRPVVAVHGDSHYFRIDKPLLDEGGRRVENFTRLETFGDNAANGNNDVQWVRVDVDPRSREVFSFQPQIVPGNRVAVPAP